MNPRLGVRRYVFEPYPWSWVAPQPWSSQGNLPLQINKIKKCGGFIITGLHMIISGLHALMSFSKFSNFQIPPCLQAGSLHHTLLGRYTHPIWRGRGGGWEEDKLGCKWHHQDIELEISTGSLLCLRRWLELTACLDLGSPSGIHCSINKRPARRWTQHGHSWRQTRKSQGLGNVSSKQPGLRTQDLGWD